jgi:hypothetical protein
VSIDGKWKVEIQTPMGKQNADFDLASDGDKLTGTATQGGNSTPIQDGSVNGDEATWKLSLTSPIPVTLTFTVNVAGDALTGSAKAAAFPAFALTGARA